MYRPQFLGVYWLALLTAAGLSYAVQATAQALPVKVGIKLSPEPARPDTDTVIQITAVDGRNNTHLPLDDCLCTVYVRDGDRPNQPTVVKTHVRVGRANISTLCGSIRFPNPGTFTILVTGTPTHVGEFPPFSDVVIVTVK
jgi:hypothetical protein